MIPACVRLVKIQYCRQCSFFFGQNCPPIVTDSDSALKYLSNEGSHAYVMIFFQWDKIFDFIRNGPFKKSLVGERILGQKPKIVFFMFL